MIWNNGSGFSSADGNFIDFTVTDTAMCGESLCLTLASFSKFFADVGNVGGAQTGIIDFGPAATQFSTVPLPPAALLFGTALAGLGILGRRRSKKAAAVTAA